jgi:transposase-like protein
LPYIRIIKITASCDEVGLPIIMDIRRVISGDLRQKVVEALERGTNTSKTARLFGVSLSAVKRYARMARREASAEAEEGAWQAPKAR